ncbi:MAG: site-specific DNA-methyltransferase [Candidatus Heimdallarchaeum endolithica]|uniref:Type II methyltransferase n=1 Tax=Candidatus Heimdallarchaeum endolithica TaxID=2876572 RepID=A0A9Y1BRW5_9ARCH|nr:MAG: site-specific DNA-methyltransferase [Candidatus Heimdallarchaeum endolithica]
MNSNLNSKRKNRYIPNKAAAEFKPTYDWSVQEAKRLYEERKYSFNIDIIHYIDCIKGMRSFPDNSIDMVIADPPFGLDFNGKESIYNRNKDNVVAGYKEIKIENYFEFTDKWIGEIPRVLKNDGGVWIFSGWTNLKDILIALEKHKLTIINHIIWKYQFGVFTRKKFVTSHYHILFAVKNKGNYFFNKIEHYPEDVWYIKRKYHTGIKKNATKLPINVVLRCIDFGSKPGDLVLDPFMGNGTTATACKGAYRHYIGFEANKQLKEIIEWNLSKITLGEYYIPYSERPDEIVSEARKKFGMETEIKK